MKFICPLIVVKDLQISRQFYEQILQQKVKLDYGENITFEGGFAIHLEEHYQKLIGQKPIAKGGNQFELYFEKDEMHELVKQLEKAEVNLVHELKEQPWRQLVIRFYDPDQHIIEVGESMEFLCKRLQNEGLEEADICNSTGLQLEFVKLHT